MTTKRQQKRIAMNAAACELRDQADRDYISARHLYILGFADQFMWQSQQALEKYLKATLLFGAGVQRKDGVVVRNPRGIRNYQHNLPRLVSDVCKLRPLRPVLSDSMRKFIGHVHDMGQNRYCDKHVYRFGDELPKLDETVWEVRRWCAEFPRVPPSAVRDKIANNDWIRSHRTNLLNKQPGPRQHIGGELERIIRSRRSSPWTHARQTLLRWNRWFFDKRRSHVSPPRWSSSSVPVSDRDWAQNADVAKLLQAIGVAP